MTPRPSGTAASAERIEAVWRRLARVHRSVEDRLESRLQSGHALTLSEFRVLRLLSRAPEGRLRMSRIAEETGLTPSAASRLVKRLEDRRGLVDRCLCDHDRRGVYTEITGEGERLLETAERTYDDALRTAWREAGEAGDLEAARRALRAAAPETADGA